MKSKLVIFLLAGLFLLPNVMADRRKYVWTYQYATIAEGAAELEFYQTTKIGQTVSWEYRIEVEHGLTPDWDLSVYQIFSQEENSALTWSAFQLRTRYRLAPYGRYFMDPLFYLEYKRKTDLKEQNKLEAKLILGKDFEKGNLAINPVYEFFWAPGDPRHELGMDVGLSYSPNFRYSLGVESVTRYEIEKDKENSTSFYVGPTFSFASGSLFYSVGYLWGLTDASDDARVRFLMGVGL